MRPALPSFCLRLRALGTHASLGIGVFLGLFLICAPASVGAQTLTVAPAPAYANSNIVLTIEGISPRSRPIFLRTYELQGTTLNVEGCIPVGFLVWTNYRFAVDLGQLPAHVYAI